MQTDVNIVSITAVYCLLDSLITKLNYCCIDVTLVCFSSTDYGSTFPNITSKFERGAVIHYYYVCPWNSTKVSVVICHINIAFFTFSPYVVLIEQWKWQVACKKL